MPSNNQKITVTTDNGTDLSKNPTLITDQHLKLTINLSGGAKDFISTDTITLNPTGDWITVIGESQVEITPKHATAEVFIKVNKDKKFSNTPQSFTVKTSNTGYKPQSFSYKVSDINSDTLSLTTDKFYIETPSGENKPDLTNPNKVKITTTVKNSSGAAIPNLSVNISANSLDSLSKVALMDAKGHPLQTKTNNFEKHQQVTLTTDPQGNLEFYVFPQQSQSVALAFYSSIEGLSIERKSKNPLFILDLVGAEFEEHLTAPDIGELLGDALKPLDNEENFHIKIPSYDGIKTTDFILYLINDNVVGNYIEVSDLSNLDNYSYKLPFSILPISKEIKFSYIIARENSNIRYSDGILFKYDGYQYGPPDSDKNRVFDLPKIYSSYGINPEFILNPGYGINFTTINQYRFNGGDTLYVEIEADSADNQKVNPGDTVAIEVFIKSSNRGDISYNKTIQLPKATSPATTSKGHIPIPISITGDVDSRISGGSAVIYILYYKVDVDNVKYSHNWKGYIDTVLPGGGIN
ncbi:hypothetical protein [Xenorhabdus ishibashii]|uniref:Uncharacterized protein n=1 Tax=Xenorhabdus ishibashii TaxID=1034471 RepID=A0A2D0KK80_9GAMM|nr:hypothetical protein [Xenorhabdus ishibashii]PHM63725.1 hypothetical protein Xish_02995 [Xenorhabdus ishibashii]